MTGDAIEPDILLARSSCSRFGEGIAAAVAPPNGLRRPVPFVALEWPFVGVGVPAGLAFAAILRVIFC